MLYNQTFNLNQVSFVVEGIIDAQQTVCPKELFFLCAYELLEVDLCVAINQQVYQYLYLGTFLIFELMCVFLISSNAHKVLCSYMLISSNPH